jgi:hypothetical protein
MTEEIPIANPPLTAQERSVANKLSKADLQAIDAAILANCSDRWLKVARVVCHTADALEKQYPGLSYVFYTERLCWLAEQGQLESKGYLLYIRHSEIRLPSQSSSGEKTKSKKVQRNRKKLKSVSRASRKLL